MKASGRRMFVVLTTAFALAACAEEDAAPVDMPALTFDYLTKLRLNVASIEIDDSWTPPGGSRQVGSLLPQSPPEALRQMAQDRLAAAGSTGQATFIIEDASVAATGDGYDGRFAVRLDIKTSDGTRAGYAEARVNRTLTGSGELGPQAARNAVYQLVSQMMKDMNVEFEYQVRRTLGSYLERGGAPVAPVGAVQSEDLGSPSGARAPAPAPNVLGAPISPLAPDFTPPSSSGATGIPKL